MHKKKSCGRELRIISAFAVIILMRIMGFAYAAEKTAPKATPKPTIKPTLKAQPQYGGVLKIIETTGPMTPFGWPPEAVGEVVVAHKPALEPLIWQYYPNQTGRRAIFDNISYT